MDEVNEKSTWVVRASFANEDGEAVTPDPSGTYRIDDEDSGDSIRAITPFTVPAGSGTADLTITSTENEMLGAGKISEVRVVTVEFGYDSGSKHGTSAYRYKLKNLKFLS